MTEKRYQVFVSSTFTDLQDERQEVMQALLELDCIPAGMELFPAANDDQWTLIKKVIDDCDYYIVIIAGRYGSIGPTGNSYTEMEYRYALEVKKPVIGFLHKNPAALPVNLCEELPENRRRLEDFRALTQTKNCRYWESPKDLGSQVSRSLIKLIKSHPAIGWVRGDVVPDESTAAELLRLRRQVDDLTTSLSMAKTTAPAGSQDLAQGSDPVLVRYEVSTYDGTAKNWESVYRQIQLSWDSLFATISPLLIDEASEQSLKSSVDDTVFRAAFHALAAEFPNRKLSDLRVYTDDFQTIKVQLRALGLIAKSEKKRSTTDKGTYWTLTAFGDSVMARLRAIKRSPAESRKQ